MSHIWVYLVTQTSWKPYRMMLKGTGPDRKLGSDISDGDVRHGTPSRDDTLGLRKF